MSLRNGGSVDNSAVEARADVLTFTTAPLDRPLEVAGAPEVRLRLISDNACCDIFARLCDVDEQGRSRNLTDQIVRSAPGEVTTGAPREVAVPLTGVSHVFRPGHRIRLQVSGGAHPRFARNLGTDGDPATSTALVPATHQVLHGPGQASTLVLPVLPARMTADAGAARADGRAAGQPAR
jgi:putative CocE/NonD family hydrolase